MKLNLLSLLIISFTLNPFIEHKPFHSSENLQKVNVNIHLKSSVLFTLNLLTNSFQIFALKPMPYIIRKLWRVSSGHGGVAKKENEFFFFWIFIFWFFNYLENILMFLRLNFLQCDQQKLRKKIQLKSLERVFKFLEFNNFNEQFYYRVTYKLRV